MAPVTEIAYFPLKAGTNVKDVNSQAGQSWANIISTVLDQDGAQRGYFGMEVENPSMLRVFVDWDTVEQHRKFLASEYTRPFPKRSLYWLYTLFSASY